MATYCIGDIQGCDEALERLLQAIDFSASRDTLFILGDLVNRGPASAQTLRRIAALGDAARSVLGNHDLHLLAASQHPGRVKRGDTLQAILAAPDRGAMLDWLRHQPLARAWEGHLMVHAGVLPAWSAPEALALAAEIEAVLRGADLADFMREMYGNRPDRWSDSLTGSERLRVIVNAFTRLRFCSAEGVMEFEAKESAGHAPRGYMPWFDVPGRRTADVTVCFGHWSTLGLVKRPDLLALDTGCVWGGCLSAARLVAGPLRGAEAEIVQVTCEQVMAPGAG